jgi:hypothetical protein
VRIKYGALEDRTIRLDGGGNDYAAGRESVRACDACHVGRGTIIRAAREVGGTASTRRQTPVLSATKRVCAPPPTADLSGRTALQVSGLAVDGGAGLVRDSD